MDVSLGFFPKAGFVTARDRCSKARSFGPVHQRLRTSPAFQFCRALSLAVTVFIQLNPESFRRCGAPRSGSRLEIQFHILSFSKNQRHERESNLNWRLHSKISMG